MNWIYLVMGFVIGIIFSVAYPDYAITINSAVELTIRSIGESGLDFVTEFINMEILKK